VGNFHLGLAPPKCSALVLVTILSLRIVKKQLSARSKVDVVRAVPRRWHVYVVDLEPRVGTKRGKQRPCVAIQPTEFAEAGLDSTVILPLTTNLVRGAAFPLRVRVQKGTAGLESDSDILVDQMPCVGQHALSTRTRGAA